MAAADRLPTLPDWPCMMDANVAALYCGLGSAPTFRRKVKEWAGFPDPDPRTGLWSRHKIDAWVGNRAVDAPVPVGEDTFRQELEKWTP